jgi:hypothetical protein
MVMDPSNGPNFKAKLPFPFFLLVAVVVLFVLYVPMFTRHDVPLPGTELLLASEPVVALPANVKIFCDKVAAVQKICPTAHVDCTNIRPEPYAALIEHAGFCATRPFDISPGNAALLLQSFQPEPLCCFK